MVECWVVGEDELDEFWCFCLMEHGNQSYYIYLQCVLYHVCFPTVFFGEVLKVGGEVLELVIHVYV